MIFNYDVANGFDVNKILKGEKLTPTANTGDLQATIDLFNEDKLGADAFKEALGEVDDAMLSYLRTCKNGEASMPGFEKHIKTTNNSIGLMGVKSKVASIGVGLLNAAVSMGISLLAGLAVEGVVYFFDNIINKSKKIAEAAQKAKEEIDEIKSSFVELETTTNGVKKRFAELAQGVDLLTNKNLTLSTDDYNEFLELGNQLAKLFPTLTKNYDDNGNAILDLSEDVNSIVFSLDELIKKQRQLASEEILEKLPDVYVDYEKNISEYTKAFNLYKKLKDTQYDVSDDKKTVTFHFGNITEKDKADLAQELTNSVKDVNSYITQDLGTLDNHDTTITLYLDTEFKGLDSDIQSVQEEYKAYKDKIKAETASFSAYMNTWLVENWDFQQIDDSGLQQALKQVLFQKDWITIAKKELDENAEWDDIAKWIKDNYINAINKIKDSDIKQSFIDLFTLPDLNPEETIDLAQKIQDYFVENEIKISLGFILDEDDQGSTQNLVQRVKENFEEATNVNNAGENYKQTYKSRKEAYSGNNYVGNVDINNRPIVTNHELGGDYQTSYTGFQEYWKGSEKDGHYEIIHFTPILPDGTVLDDATLYDYLDNIIAKADNALDADKVENGGLGILYKVDTSVNGQKITDANLGDAYFQADQWDIEMHETQAKMYDEEAYALINYNKALEEQNKLIQYFNDHSINTNQEYEKWLEVTQGVQSAEEKIKKYNEYLSSRPNTDTSFFTPENLQSIDDYKTKISNLSSYLSSINATHSLSADQMATLNTEYGITSDSVDGYKDKIIGLINETSTLSPIIKLLADAIENCTNASEKASLEALLDSLQDISKEAIETAEGFDNMGNAMSSLKSQADLLRDVNNNIKEFGRIDTSQLSQIMTMFPELTNQVALYSAGLMSANDLFGLLEQSYQTDAEIYAAAMAEKLQYNEQFYSSIYDDLPQHILDLAETYKIDLDNYKTLCAAKLDLETKLAEKRVELYAAITKAYNISRDQYASPEEKEQVQNEYRVVQKEFNDIQSIFDSVRDTSFKQFDTTWKSFGKDSEKEKDKEKKKKKEKDTQKIDWADQALSVLQEAVDDAQTSLENTDGFQAQIDAIDTLNTALGALKGGYQKAYTEYETRYTNGLKKLSNPDEIQRKIESGKSFKLKEYSSEDAEIIQELIDLYSKMTDAEDKISELETQIYDNEHLEKSKIRQADLESQLNTVEEKLNDTSLSTKDKIDLLEQRYELQKSINDELRIQAKLEGNTEKVKQLDAEDKNNEQQEKSDIYDANKEDVLRSVGKNNNEITDIQNAIDLEGKGTKKQYEKIITLQEENIGEWEKQKQIAYEMREANKDNAALYEYWDNELQDCEDNIYQMNSGIKEMQQAILNLPLQEVEEKLQSINKELDSRNRELDEQSELINAAIAVYDEQIEIQNEIKEGIQDRIDALQEEHDLREANLNVQKAEWELQKAKENHNVKVFREGVGFVFESNQEEVQTAQENLDNAKYERRIQLLNEEIKKVDKNIDSLTKQKKQWEDIIPLMERAALITKAEAYDMDFKNKVLSGTAGLLDTISKKYGEIYSKIDLLEESKKPYELLQDELTNISQLHSVDGISYDDAMAQTMSALQKYYPEIVAKYDEQKTSLEEVAKKQLESVGVTEETSEDNVKEVKKTNEEITQSYDTMLTELTDIFGQLSSMLSDFANKANDMAKSVLGSVATISSAISNNDSIVDGNMDVINDVTVTKYIKLDDSYASKYKNVAKLDTAINIKPVATTPLVSIPKTTNNKTTSISFGDINVTGVQNANEFAKAIVSSLPNAMKQELYK